MPDQEDRPDEDKEASPEPYSGIVLKTVEKIQDEPLLFIIAIVALIIGLSIFLTNLGSADLRFITVIIAILAFVGIIGHYLREAQNLPVDVIRPDKQIPAPERNGEVPDTPLDKPQPNRTNYPKLPKLHADEAQRKNLVDALRACPSIQDRHTRDAIVQELRQDIRSNINRHAAENVDVNNIVRTCSNYDGGLVELIERVRFYEGDSQAMRSLDLQLDEIKRSG